MRVHQVQSLAEYNRWMNQRLYAVCAELPDDERRRDRGVFFRSIHGTLNHLLLADRVWMARFQGGTFKVAGLDQELYADFAELSAERERTDAAIVEWAASLSDDILAGELRYTSIVNPEPRVYDMWLAVTHFFNHQTHHRGQLTAMLSQCGKDYGITDLIWLPQALEEGAAG